MATLFEPETHSAAIISECGLYRYRLERTWDATKRQACFVMLNPSTADAYQDDPTIRRCIGFAKSWGRGGIIVVNLFAFRSTDPAALSKVKDPIGPENDQHIRRVVEHCQPVVAAWGAHAAARGRGNYVWTILQSVGVPLLCLGKTKDGHPKHPLYLPASATLIPFAG